MIRKLKKLFKQITFGIHELNETLGWTLFKPFSYPKCISRMDKFLNEVEKSRSEAEG